MEEVQLQLEGPLEKHFRGMLPSEGPYIVIAINQINNHLF